MNILIVGGTEKEIEEWEYILERTLPDSKNYHANGHKDIVRCFSKAPPSLVLLSTSLEHYEWTEGVELIRIIDKDIPIVLTSEDERLAVKAYSYGMFDYWVKPIKKEYIERALLKVKNIEKS